MKVWGNERKEKEGSQESSHLTGTVINWLRTYRAWQMIRVGFSFGGHILLSFRNLSLGCSFWSSLILWGTSPYLLVAYFLGTWLHPQILLVEACLSSQGFSETKKTPVQHVHYAQNTSVCSSHLAKGNLHASFHSNPVGAGQSPDIDHELIHQQPDFCPLYLQAGLLYSHRETLKLQTTHNDLNKVSMIALEHLPFE